MEHLEKKGRIYEKEINIYRIRDSVCFPISD